jgi:hypothetical protein
MSKRQGKAGGLPEALVLGTGMPGHFDAKNIAQIARLRIISLDNMPILCYTDS